MLDSAKNSFTIETSTTGANNMTIVRTLTGYRAYGSFTAIVDFSVTGEVTYSNLNPDAPEYDRIVRAFKYRCMGG